MPKPNEILEREELAEGIVSLRVYAPDIARKAKPGHFLIVRTDEAGERIPLTVAEYDKDTVTIVIQAVGNSTREIASLKKGDVLLDFAGPLGIPSHIEENKTVCLVAGGSGCAEIYPIAKSIKEKKGRVIIIVGARSQNLLFWEDKFEKIADEFIICTNDGSKGIKGFVTTALEGVMKKEKLDEVIAVGPIPMMNAVANLTKGKVKTKVSLNAIMVDGIGMCGCCRVTVGGKVRFVCVDGPEFDAHEVNFDEITKRNSLYKEEESHVCKIK